MKVRKISVTSVFDCPPGVMWEKLLDFDTLTEICKPRASFKPVAGTKLPEKWAENVVYRFRLFIAGLIPMGVHEIVLERIDRELMEIQSRERNRIVTVWDHLITLRRTDDGRTAYTDEVELYAGLFTCFTARWAIGLYRHRQRKWRKIIELLK